MTKCRHCGNVTGYFVFDVCLRCQADGKDARVSVRKNERSQAIVPLLDSGRVFLTGTPWGDKANIAPLTPESREHIDIMEYTARFHHRCGKYETAISGGCDKPRGHEGYCGGPMKTPTEKQPRHTACPGCGSTVSFTVNDCLAHHAFGGRPCAWNGRQRAVVEQEQNRMREAPGIWCAGNGTWSCSRTDAHPRAACYDGRGQGIPTGVSDLRPSPFQPKQPSPPQPPTLREWLGDRVSDLGRWAEVLREQPVPAGPLVRWEWRGRRLYGQAFGEWSEMTLSNLLAVIGPDREKFYPMGEAIQMALFTRHPDVKPEPRPAAFPWDPYPEVV